MDVARVIQKVMNVVTPAVRSEWVDGGHRYVNTAGKPRRSSAMWSGSCVSLCLKMRWVDWTRQDNKGRQ